MKKINELIGALKRIQKQLDKGDPRSVHEIQFKDNDAESLLSELEEVKKHKRILTVIEGYCLSKADNSPLLIESSIENDRFYTLAHLASDCENKHEDWWKELNELEAELIENNYIPQPPRK